MSHYYTGIFCLNNLESDLLAMTPTRTIETSRFGTITVDEAMVIRFLQPIFGFEQITEYVVLDHSEESPFRWLQAVNDANLAFVVTNPKFFGINYEFALSEEVASRLEIQESDDAMVLTIVNIPQDDPGKMTANLLGPLVVNQPKMMAMQIVLNDTQYNTKMRLLADDALTETTSGTSSPSSDEG
jgi:flagellar assembly factor FliW